MVRRKGTYVNKYIGYAAPVYIKKPWIKSEGHQVIRGNWVVYEGTPENARKIYDAFLSVGVHGGPGFERRLRPALSGIGRKIKR